MNSLFWVVIGLGGLIIAIVSIFNFFIQIVNRTDEAWADIGVQLKRKYDLIPNLLNLVKGYAKHEAKIIETLVEARKKALGSTGVSEVESADNQLSPILNKVLALAEDTPQIRSSENYVELQKQLTETENTLASARRFYNANVRDLNIWLETFPTNIVGKIFNFKKREYFQNEQA